MWFRYLFFLLFIACLVAAAYVFLKTKLSGKFKFQRNRLEKEMFDGEIDCAEKTKKLYKDDPKYKKK